MNGALKFEVDKLVDIYKGIQRDKDADKAHKLSLQPRREIIESPQYQVCAFWCNQCRKDYNATGRKLVEGHGKQASAVYCSQCPDGHDNYRYITDVPFDPYFNRSRNVQIDRAKYANDLISPHDDNFKRLYPKHWLEYEQRREQYDRANKST